MNNDVDKKVCITCKTNINGKFCSNCGEKIIDKEDYSLKNFLHNVFNAFTNIDSNFIKSFYLLIKKPGFLTKEYLIGRRIPYLKPVQMFLIANLLYFFIQPFSGVHGFNTPLNSQIKKLPYSKIVNKMLKEKISRLNISYDDYEKKYNKKSETYAKTLIFLMIPMFALILKLLYIKSKKYFVEHLVFSVHFFTFFIFYIFILLIIILRSLIYFLFIIIPDFIPDFVLQNITVETISIILMFIILFIYFYHSLNYFYGGRKVINALKSSVIPICTLLVIQIYRFILFFITFYSI